jgi:phospholipase A1/A2
MKSGWHQLQTSLHSICLRVYLAGLCVAISDTFAFAQATEPAKSALEGSQQLEPLEQFGKYIAPYEPIYFLMGPEHPAVKFQLSMKFMPLSLADSWIQPAFAYTQTSFWDIFAPSAPFFDTSYKPTVFVNFPNVLRNTNVWHLDVQTGYQHESNGRGGVDSRSLNYMYLQPRVRLGDPARLHATLTPRAWFYVMDLSDNPDIDEYRGHINLQLKGGYEKYEMAVSLQMGDKAQHAGVQIDLTAPLLRRYHFTPYFHVQYFNGFGETLHNYNQRTESVRFGFSLYQ